MSVRVVCVVFFVCQFAWLGDSTSPYGSNGPLNGHDVGKKGPENRYQDHDKSRTSGTHTCSDDFVFRSNYIIRTSESLENSAVFIDSIKVGSSDSCIANCCDANDVIDEDGKSVTCDLAVFVDVEENKGKKLESNCFLFQCRFDTGERNRCLFSEHDGYVSNMIGGFGEEAAFPEREEEEVEEEVPQTKRPAPATTKGRDENKETEDTDDEGTEDNQCNDHQYECNNGECIRLSLLCDDYNDCEDESDEKEDTCTELNGLWKIWRYMYGSSAADYVTEYPPVAAGQDKGPEDHVVEDEDKAYQETTGDEDKEQIVKVPTTNGILNTKQDNGDAADEVMETQQSGSPSENPTSNQSSSSNSKTNEEKDSSGTKTGTKTEESVAAHSDVRVEDINNQGGVTATAVLPLTIGLFLTMFLLLMMSCRLRYMNRRLRYGRLKTNNAHDADYLINGMYL